MELNDGVKRLGRMAGIASIDRNLQTEDAAYAQDMLEEDANAPGDEMRNMAARDVTIYYGASPSPTSSTPAPTLKSAMQSVIAKALPYVLAAVLGAGLASALKPAEIPPEIPPDADTQYMLDLLPDD